MIEVLAVGWAPARLGPFASEGSQKSCEIYLVPIEGGLNPNKLNHPLPAGSDIEASRPALAQGESLSQDSSFPDAGSEVLAHGRTKK